MTTSDSSLKRCFKCGLEKDRSEFYAHPMMGDGLLGKCKECTKRDARETRARAVEYYRNYDRARYYAEGHRAPASREAVNRGHRAWDEKNAHKKRAHVRVKRAIAAGVLVPQPCAWCGSTYRIQAHHEDYDKPLDVVWLCTTCHGIRHRRCPVEEMRPPSGHGGWGRNRTFEPDQMEIPGIREETP